MNTYKKGIVPIVILGVILLIGIGSSIYYDIYNKNQKENQQETTAEKCPGQYWCYANNECVASEKDCDNTYYKNSPCNEKCISFGYAKAANCNIYGYEKRLEEQVMNQFNAMVSCCCDIENSENDKNLLKAAGDGNLEKIKELIKAGADVNVRDEDGWTPLMHSAKNGDLTAFKELIKAGADVNERLGPWDFTSVTTITQSVDIIKELMSMGVDVSDSLYTAIDSKNLVFIKKLINVGIINATPPHELEGGGCTTPMINAVEINDIEIVKELIKAGADLSGCLDHELNYQKTPLRIATENKYAEIVDVLKKAGAKE